MSNEPGNVVFDITDDISPTSDLALALHLCQ